MKKTLREMQSLSTIVGQALQIHGIETGFTGVSELPLNGEVVLSDGRTAYAVTRLSVVTWSDGRVKFINFPPEDLRSLRERVAEEYGLDA